MTGDAYLPVEVRGKSVQDVVEWAPEHDPAECFRFRYYVSARDDIEKVTHRIALEETTGRWIGRFAEETDLYRSARAQAVRMERYGPGEAVIDVLSPVANIDLDADPFYQLQMLSVGGPILEFVFYDRVAFLDFELPESVLRLFPGPRYGIRRVREEVGLPDGSPVVGTIVKPCCGLSPAEVAERIARAVRGGACVIKDDEKMMNPAYCPLEEKVRTVRAALDEVEAETGRRAIYMPHVPYRTDRLREMALRVREWGAGGVMFNATLAHSLGAMQVIAGDPDLDMPIYCHCGGLAALTTGPRRIDARVIAKLARLCGADFFQIGVFGVTDCHVNSLDASLLHALAGAFRDEWGGAQGHRLRDGRRAGRQERRPQRARDAAPAARQRRGAAGRQQPAGPPGRPGGGRPSDVAGGRRLHRRGRRRAGAAGRLRPSQGPGRTRRPAEVSPR